MPWRQDLSSKMDTAAKIISIWGTEGVVPLQADNEHHKKIALCHGTFDLVHPGHLRHLAYVRQRCDVLVVSITSDRYVTKGNHRPYVPQQLRAESLAALQMVDYVVIDDEPTPISLIRALKPDIFAKGADYQSGENLRTKIETDLVQSYGGQMLFTPGDVLYSSTAIINQSPPDISFEKLATLMRAEKISFQNLTNALWRSKPMIIDVVGDLIVDTITRVKSLGYNGKTPHQSVLVESSTNYIGGAGIVALHLAAAGADVNLTSVVGDDGIGAWAVGELQALSKTLTIDFIIDGRPTTNKNAIVCDGQRLLKVDTGDYRGIEEKTVKQIIASYNHNVDAVVFSDFRHGMFHKGSTERLLKAAPVHAYLAADSQVASRWGNVLDFAGCYLICANEHEARFALGDQDTAIRPLGTHLYSRAICKTLLLKCGARGLIGYRSPTGDPRSFFAVDSFARKVVDPVGAGDALLAYAVAVHESGPVVQAIIGSIAAGLECEVEGNIPISSGQVLARIEEIGKVLA